MWSSSLPVCVIESLDKKSYCTQTIRHKCHHEQLLMTLSDEDTNRILTNHACGDTQCILFKWLNLQLLRKLQVTVFPLAMFNSTCSSRVSLPNINFFLLGSHCRQWLHLITTSDTNLPLQHHKM